MGLLRIAVTTIVALASSGAFAGTQARGQSPDGAQRELYARLIAMTDTRTIDTAAIDASLSSAFRPLAAFAALSVGQLGPVEAVPRVARLRALLADPRSQVAAGAAYSLGLLRDTAGTAGLAAAVASSDPPRAAEAAWALGQIGEPARDAISTSLRSAGRTRGVRVQLLLAAAKLRPVPIDAVLPHMRDSDGSVVWAAAYAVARPRVPGGVRALVELASRPAAHDRVRASASAAAWYDLGASAPARIRAEIARGLARSAAGDSLADSAFAVLARLARDPHPHVRINALRSLAGYESRAVALLDAATLDRDPNVRLAALQAIATAPGLALDWQSLWARDTSFTYRRYVAEAAVASGTVPPPIENWRTDRDWRRRAAVAAVAAAARDPRAREMALPLAHDPDPRVRAAALSALAADTVPVSDTVRALVLRALSDSDEATRATALAALNRRPRPEDLPLVLDALERSARDAESDARVAAIGYLAAAWRRDSAAFTPAVRERLAGTAPSADPVARAAAAGVPPLRHWRADRLQPRAMSWYRAAVDGFVAPSLAGRPPVAVIRTSRGPITLELFGGDAPLTVRNFVELARRRYYDGVAFHRVVPNFVVQDGDPRGDGSGGPGYSIRDELNPRRYERSVLGMALSGPDTGGSQYFITHSPQPHLDGGYTAFGRVIAGHAVLDALMQGDRVVRVDIR